MDTAPVPMPKLRRELRTTPRNPDQDQEVRSGRPQPLPTPTRLSQESSALSPDTATPVCRSTVDGDDPLGGGAVPEAIETVLRRRRGTGVPLADSVAQDMSAGFGTDLTGVRVHTDPEAARISRQLQAVAFTRGQDIYFGTGAYRPESTPGRRLLAHELAHVVQQGRPTAVSGPRSVIGRADDPAERQADELAARVVRRSPAPAASGPTIQRYTVDKKNTKANKLLRARYIKVKDPDDAEYYGNEFDGLVEETATIEKMEIFVAGLEKTKAAIKIVVPPIVASPSPGPTPELDGSKPAAGVPALPSSIPASSVPDPGTGPTRKEKSKTTTYTLGPSAYVAKPTLVVDPYAGLPVKLRGLAVQITAWKTNSMVGTAETLSASERDTLQAWVESRRTASGKQKYVVNIGPGTGLYTGETQFKVSGFGSVGGKAPTFHITL